MPAQRCYTSPSTCIIGELPHCTRTRTQRLLPTYRPWPPPIVLHHYLASSAPQLHPRRALNPLTMAIGPPNESPIHCVMHVALDASPVGARWLKHFWSDTFKILTG